MFKTLFTALAVFAGANIAHATTGFDLGNEFKATEVRGQLWVTCPSRIGGQTTTLVNCSGEILDPSEFARFHSDDKVDADSVDLKATHEDGSTRSKSGGYSSAKSRSSDKFNLWIWSLTQRPLLDMGANKVDYQMKKNGAVVSKGTFTATVKDGGVRDCHGDSTWSQNPADCEGGSSICDWYFQNQNWCE